MYIVYDAIVIITIILFTVWILNYTFIDAIKNVDSALGWALWTFVSNKPTTLLAVITIIVAYAYTGMILGCSMWSAFYEEKTSLFHASGDGQLHFLLEKLSSLLTEPIYFIIFGFFIWIITFAALKYLGKEENHILSVKPTVISFFLVEFYFLITIIFIYLLSINSDLAKHLMHDLSGN